jgi:hypothetical protein
MFLVTKTNQCLARSGAGSALWRSASSLTRISFRSDLKPSPFTNRERFSGGRAEPPFQATALGRLHSSDSLHSEYLLLNPPKWLTLPRMVFQSPAPFIDDQALHILLFL